LPATQSHDNRKCGYNLVLKDVRFVNPLGGKFDVEAWE
jgi:hypothetical protein